MQLKESCGVRDIRLALTAIDLWLFEQLQDLWIRLEYKSFLFKALALHGPYSFIEIFKIYIGRLIGPFFLQLHCIWLLLILSLNYIGSLIGPFFLQLHFRWLLLFYRDSIWHENT